MLSGVKSISQQLAPLMSTISTLSKLDNEKSALNKPDLATTHTEARILRIKAKIIRAKANLMRYQAQIICAQSQNVVRHNSGVGCQVIPVQAQM